MEAPKNEWFIREIPMKFPLKWMIWGFPYSRKPPCGFVQFLEKNTQIHFIAGVTVQVAILRGP
jgi:hypothetical protein